MKSDNDLTMEAKWATCNFIAYAMTPWQLRGIEAAIFYLREKGVEPSGFIILVEHEITGRCVNSSMISCGEQINVIECSKWKFDDSKNKIRNRISQFYSIIKNRRSENKVYVLNAGKVDFRWIGYVKEKCKKGTKYILLDDGLGGYTGYRGARSLWWIKIPVYDYLIKQLKRRGLYIDFRIMNIKSKTLISNPDVSTYYEQSFKRADKKIDKYLRSLFSDKIIINTQCLYDNKEIDGEQDINVWKKLYDALEGLNGDVIVKLHPRELSIERYKEFPWEIAPDCEFSQEEIIATSNIKPKCIVGITTSTLINISALFGIKTISLARLFLKEIIPDSSKRDCEDFIKLANNLVLIPHDENELRQAIKEIADH